MAEGKSDDQEKTEEPSQYKIEESRRKGEVASSKELNSVLVLSSALLTLALTSVMMFEILNDYIVWLLTYDFGTDFNQVYMQELVTRSVVTMIKVSAPVFLSSFIVGFFAQVAQVGFLFAPDVLTLKLERINPISGIQRVFGKKALSEAVKGILKFLVIIGIAYLMLKDEFEKFNGFLQSDFILNFSYGKFMFLKLFYSIVAGLVFIAVIDFAWEKFQYRKKMMMSKQEAKEESKEKEGKPEIKQEIKSIQREMAQKRMITEIPNADVIVTNPTHISIALKYDSQKMLSPIVLAKGADFLAMKIREIAKEHDIPLVENISLARSLYKTVDVGEKIPRDFYKTVAEILAFVHKLKKRKKALSSGEATV